MANTEQLQLADVSADNLYVCEYNGQETISRGRDVELWNEGLAEHLAVNRDLGRIVHSWTVTEAGVRTLRTDQVTDDGKLVMVPSADSQQEHTLIVEDVEPTLVFPEQLFTVSQIRAAANGATTDKSAASKAELEALTAEAPEIAVSINDDIRSAYEARYNSWRDDLRTHPEGTNFQYQIPLEDDWKRTVLTDRTDLSPAQVEILATAGYPASMSVTIDVDTPDIDERPT